MPILVSHITPPFPARRMTTKIRSEFAAAPSVLRMASFPQPRPSTSANEGLQINNISRRDTHSSVRDATSNMLSSSKLQEYICLKTRVRSC